MRILKDRNARAWLRVLAQCYAPGRYTLALVLVLSGLSAGLSALSPLLTKAIFDQALPARDTRLLVYLGAGWALALAAASVTAFLYNYLVTKTDCEATSRLRTRVFRSCLLDLSVSGETGQTQGQRLSRIVRDPEALVGEAGVRPLLSSIIHAFTLLLVCGLAFYLDRLLAVVSVASGLLIALSQVRTPRIVKDAGRALSSVRAEVTGRIENLLAAWRMIVRHGRTAAETAFADAEFGRLAASQMEVQKKKYFVSLRVSLLLHLTPIMLVVVAVHRMMAGSMSVGTLVAFFSYNAMINSALAGLLANSLRLWSGYGQTMECVTLIVDSETREAVRGARGRDGLACGDCVQSLAMTGLVVTAGEHVVRAARVGFERGRTYLFTGDSGTGKTVFLEFLAGIRGCAAGDITLNGSRCDADDYMQYARRYGLVLKDEVLFDRCVMDNLTYGLGGRDGGEWRSWLTMLRMEYACRDGVKGLSAGEKQRISFVRELLRRPSFFIIDEGLDSLEKDLGQDALALLRRVLPDAILIICTHNWRQQLPVYDVLTVMDGEITQQICRGAGVAG